MPEQFEPRGSRLVRIESSFLEQLNDILAAIHSDIHSIHNDLHVLTADTHDVASATSALMQRMLTIEIQLTRVIRKEDNSMNELTEVLAEVRNTRDVEAAAKTAILGMLQKIQDAVDSQADPAAISQILDELRAGSADLAAAIPANTSADTGNSTPSDSGNVPPADTGNVPPSDTGTPNDGTGATVPPPDGSAPNPPDVGNVGSVDPANPTPDSNA